MNELIIDIDNGENYINKYNKERLNDELYNYIIEEIKGMELYKDLIIKVYSNYELTDDEKNSFIEMLKNTIGSDIQENLLIQKHLYWKCLFLAMIGILGILLSNYLRLGESTILSELFLIVGWVGVWESLYIVLFDEAAEKIRTRRLKRVVNAKVEFYCN